MAEERLHQAADKIEIMDLSSNYMRGLDRLDRELERSVFWDDAFCFFHYLFFFIFWQYERIFVSIPCDPA